MRLAIVWRLLFCFVALCASTRAVEAASAAEYPSKPIRLIVPFAPGGTNDVLGRLVALHLHETMGKPVIVDNRPGADGLIGTELAVRATPDGYTLIVVSAAYVMNPAVRKLPYDPITAFEFIAKMGATFTILSVAPTLPVSSVKELIALAQAKPGHVVLSSSGGFMHFASALFRTMSKQDFNIVLYKGGYPAMVDVMTGQAQATFAVIVPALPHLRAGKLKGLAVGSLKRSTVLPDLPTLDELGLAGYDASNWYSIATAAATPKPIVARLYKEVAAYFRQPETVKKLTAMGAEIDVKSPDEMRKLIPAEIAKWTQVAVDAGMPRDVK